MGEESRYRRCRTPTRGAHVSASTLLGGSANSGLSVGGLYRMATRGVVVRVLRVAGWPLGRDGCCEFFGCGSMARGSFSSARVDW